MCLVQVKVKRGPLLELALEKADVALRVTVCMQRFLSCLLACA